jgi:uncharacterized membrane protein
MWCYLAALGLLNISTVAIANPASKEMSYKKDVKPIIHDYCLNCHEPGGKGYEKSGLDMTTYQTLMKGTKFGSVIKPGDSFTSIFIQVIEGRVHSSIKMPYGMAGGLAKENISILKKWVEQGAKEN